MVSPVLVSTRTARLSSVTSAIEPSSVKSTPSIRRLSVRVDLISPVSASKTYSFEVCVVGSSLTMAATVEPSRETASRFELAGRFGSLSGNGNDQSGMPLLVDLKPWIRKSFPGAFDSK